jgi:hypothetical protein
MIGYLDVKYFLKSKKLSLPWKTIFKSSLGFIISFIAGNISINVILMLIYLIGNVR